MKVDHQSTKSITNNQQSQSPIINKESTNKESITNHPSSTIINQPSSI